ncbi:DegQ family serine endoprotease [Oligoflexia bacterium]|nr:DegQ family serine endoprotease [Oligoflexia bacterium]
MTNRNTMRAFPNLGFLTIIALFFLSYVHPNSAVLQSAKAESPEESLLFAKKLSVAFEQAADSITPSVVNISTVKKASPGRGQMKDPFFDQFRRFFGDRFPSPQMPDNYAQKGFGSGVIIDRQGHILTNNHVVGEADELTVQLHDQRTFDAKIVGTDPKSDLAVIKISAKGLSPARLGDSDDLNIGEWVVAAGAPFGLSNTITAGIVSAKGRSLYGGGNYEDFIQTDAAINPGNSGGPLINLKGEVIGINTAIFSRSGGYMGIGFAIPSNMAQSVMKSLIKTGRVIRGWLGVVIQPLTEDLAASFNFSGTNGILIGFIQKDSPADRAGLRQGDIVTRLNGSEIEEINQLRNTVAATKPGSHVKVTVVREGKIKNIKVKIGELPTQAEEDNVLVKNDETTPNIGLSLESLTPELARRLGTSETKGMVVNGVQPGGLASSSGLAVGDIILKVNNRPIASHADVKKAITKASLKKGLRLIVESKEMQRFVFIKSKE